MIFFTFLGCLLVAVLLGKREPADLTLPKVDGWNVLATILASSPTTSVLVITGTLTPETEKFKFDNYDKDNIDVYYKPIVDRHEFVAIIKGLIASALRKDSESESKQLLE